MLEKLEIKNFKSILNDTISLGRVNVFIGENGVGKSNILEALLFASVSNTYDVVDPDILYSNGFRVCKPSLLLSSFSGVKQAKDISVNLDFNPLKIYNTLTPEDKDRITSKWINVDRKLDINILDQLLVDNSLPRNYFSSLAKEMSKLEPLHKEMSKLEPLHKEMSKLKSLQKEISELFFLQKESQEYKDLSNYIIYTLNTAALRGIPEFQKSRKGIYGENLDAIIHELDEKELAELKEYVYSVSWLDDFFIDEEDTLKKEGYKLNYSKSLLYFRDKYMLKSNNVFSSENSNEGILHILFYLATLIGKKRPRLFAIDNIETSLNPHLCRHLMMKISDLAKRHDKQMLITTHNPAILDGLNLFDDDIRLFEVYRTDKGNTKTRRITLNEKMQNKKHKLSELWTKGLLGAISKDF